MRRRAFNKALAECAGIGKVGHEMRVAVRAFFLLGKEGHVVAGIVGELVGVAGVERLARAEHGLERLRVGLQQRRIADLLHHLARAVHREDVRRLDHLVAADERLPVLVVVAVDGERQALQKRAVDARRAPTGSDLIATVNYHSRFSLS